MLTLERVGQSGAPRMADAVGELHHDMDRVGHLAVVLPLSNAAKPSHRDRGAAQVPSRRVEAVDANFSDEPQ